MSNLLVGVAQRLVRSKGKDRRDSNDHFHLVRDARPGSDTVITRSKKTHFVGADVAASSQARSVGEGFPSNENAVQKERGLCRGDTAI